MKRRSLLGILGAAALTMVLAACVYDEAGTGAPPVGGGQNHFPNATATFTPGTFRSAPIGGASGTEAHTAWLAETGLTGMGWRRGPMVVEVDFSANQILDIRLISHGESAYGAMYLYRAYPMVPDQILMQQSTNDLRVIGPVGAMRDAGLDVFVGGTATQASLVLAVEDAIRQAGVADPTTLVAHPLPARPLPGDRFVPGSHTVYVPAGYYNFNFNTNQFSLVADMPQWPTEMVGSTAWAQAWDGAFTSSVVNGYSRVLFANPIFGRNPSAVHGSTLAESARPVLAGMDATFPTAVINNVAREMGFDPAGPNPFYREGHPGGTPVGIWLTVNFGRNYFQLMEHQSGDGLGTAGSGGAARPFSGESLAPNRDHTAYGQANFQTSGINGSSSSQALGGYFWIQTAHRSINDNQSTQHILADTYVSATQSALGIRRGVEMAMMLAGATQAEINSFAPRGNNNSPFWREPFEAGLNLIPGRYVVPVPGFDVNLNVVMCRSVIRYIAIADPATGSSLGHQYAQAEARATTLEPIVGTFVLPEWALQDTRDNPGSTHAHQEDYGTSFRGRLLFAFADTYADGGRTAASFERAGYMPSNPEFSAAIIQALQNLVSTHNYGNINQAGRLGTEVVPSPFR